MVLGGKLEVSFPHEAAEPCDTGRVQVEGVSVNSFFKAPVLIANTGYRKRAISITRQLNTRGFLHVYSHEP